MAVQTPHPIYLIVEFDWPSPRNAEAFQKAKHLHQIVRDQSWIEEVVAGSGGVGTGPSSIWIFRLENYAALDRLLRDRSDAISQAYVGFFSEMENVRDKIREAVAFMPASSM